MKILCPAILDGYTRRKDRTVSLRFITQEKTSSEVMNIDETLDQFGVLYFRGQEQMNKEEISELDNVELDLYDDPKTQSQRLRNVLFVFWKQEGSNGDFKKFYKQKTEEIIQHFKNKLEDV
jgi:uncharacterized Fe-S cluster-containing protein|tara:strand:- start:92 stop:454 length:363 start_codon:yes stop_codon:yes gene_type:complete